MRGVGRRVEERRGEDGRGEESGGEEGRGEEVRGEEGRGEEMRGEESGGEESSSGKQLCMFASLFLCVAMHSSSMRECRRLLGLQTPAHM